MAQASVNIIIRATDLASNSLKGIAGSLSNLKSLVAGFVAFKGMSSLTNDFIEANSQLEQMNLRMKALLGTANASKGATAWIIDFAMKNPVRSIEQTGEAFRELINSGINPTTGAMEALIGASVKYGMTTSEFKGVMLSLRQTGAMTTQMKQELNQFAQRVPEFTKKIAAEFNMTQEEFLKAVEKRQIKSKDSILAVLRIFKEGSAQAMEDYAQTWEGKMTKLRNSWTLLLQDVGNNGIFGAIKGGLDKAISLMDDLRDSTSQAALTVQYLADFFVYAGNEGMRAFTLLGNSVFGQKGVLQTSFSAFMNNTIAGFSLIALGISELVGKIVLTFKAGMERLQTLAHAIKLAMGGDNSLKSALDDQKKYADMAAKIAAQIERLKKSTPEGDFLYDAERIKNLETSYKTLTAQSERYAEIVRAIVGTPAISIDDILDTSSFKKGFDDIGKQWLDMDQKLKDFEAASAEAGKAPIEGVAARMKREKDKYAQDLEDALAGFVNAGDESAPRTFAAGWIEAFNTIQAEAKALFGDIQAMGKYTANALNSAFTSGFQLMFEQLKTGALDVKAVMMNMLDSVYDAMARILAQRMAMGVLESVGGMFASGASAQQGTGASSSTGMGSNDSFMRAKATTSNSQSIQIINNSGEKLEVTQARSKSTGQDQVVSIVIDSIMRNKNGSLDMLIGALA